jgi:CheY-like chemotaxis protein
MARMSQVIGYELGAIESLQKPIDRSRLKELIAPYAEVPERSVLVVEDDEATRETIKKVMESEGWTVKLAKDGAVGLERAAEQSFDLILLDLMMPVLDGFEFLQTLRTGSLLSRESPVVVVTAKNLDDADRALLEGSVHQVVAKSGDDLDWLVSDAAKYLERP